MAKPGERLEHTGMGSGVRWTDTYPAEDRPAHAPMLVPGKEWHFIGPHSGHAVVGRQDVLPRDAVLDICAAVVEMRKLEEARISEDVVVVFREGWRFQRGSSFSS